MESRRLIQILPTAAFGDAIGNETIAIYNLLQENGYRTEVYAEGIDPRFQLKTIKPINELNELNEKDVIIYHGSTGTDLNYRLKDYDGFKILIYHNITPPHFFDDYSTIFRDLTKRGYEGIKALKNDVDYCIADSSFNADELKKMGYRCPVEVCPILIPFEEYKQQPDSIVKSRYQEESTTNIVFVGRIAPNKKQEDIIKAFYCYQKRYNTDSRLILVGSFSGMEKYKEKLCRYADALEIGNKVFFTGHVSFLEILAYYDTADVFVCMSEHEGFCVPLVEAMLFNVPIIAFDAGAVSETMGKGGLLLKEKSPELAARLIDEIVHNKDLKQALLTEQKKQLAHFDMDVVSSHFLNILNNALNEKL